MLFGLMDARHLEVVSIMGGPLHERVPALLLIAATDH